MDKAIGWGTRWTSVQKADTTEHVQRTPEGQQHCCRDGRRKWASGFARKFSGSAENLRKESIETPSEISERYYSWSLLVTEYVMLIIFLFHENFLWLICSRPAGFQLGIWNKSTRLSTEDSFPGRKLSSKIDFRWEPLLDNIHHLWHSAWRENPLCAFKTQLSYSESNMCAVQEVSHSLVSKSKNCLPPALD